MSFAYTPGLKVKEFYTLRKERKLPILGQVLVKEGDVVKHDTIVATTKLPGEAYVAHVADALGLDPEEEDKISPFMLKNVGEEVEEGELIAKCVAWFGLSKKECLAPHKGTIDTISDLSGQVFIKEPDRIVELNAYIPGKIVATTPEESVVVESTVTFIQGIFGIGGEVHGEIMVIDGSQSNDITEEQITPECKGKILVGGSSVTPEALQKAVEVGVLGIVVGGVNDQIINQFLGYEIGVAITGNEDCGITFIITDGFGSMKMQEKVFNLLKSLEGEEASINGATQIRAGVIRPEVIVPREGANPAMSEKDEQIDSGVDIGTKIRIICEPYFGAIGHVYRLPVELQRIETESDVRILEVELEDGSKVTIPRANMELIEE